MAEDREAGRRTEPFFKWPSWCQCLAYKGPTFPAHTAWAGWWVGTPLDGMSHDTAQLRASVLMTSYKILGQVCEKQEEGHWVVSWVGLLLNSTAQSLSLWLSSGYNLLLFVTKVIILGAFQGHSLEQDLDDWLTADYHMSALRLGTVFSLFPYRAKNKALDNSSCWGTKGHFEGLKFPVPQCFYLQPMKNVHLYLFYLQG